MAGKENGFNAYVYEDDYVEIQKLVQHYPNIETGGDLFGLWQDEENVVIQLFIGPGKRSQRTTTSFHQDVEYLHKVGTVITKEEGLCNLGEWHSHHQIGMPAPSAADKRTVLSNLTQLGLERFVLFIASIDTSSERKKRHHDIALDQIKINCFMFREGLPARQQPIEGKIIKIEGKNPLRLKNKAESVIRMGAESPPPSGVEGEYGSNEPREKRSAGRQNDENKSPNTGRNEMKIHQPTPHKVSQQVFSPQQPPFRADNLPSPPRQQNSRPTQPHPTHGDFDSQRSSGKGRPGTTGQHVSSIGSQSHGAVSTHRTTSQAENRRSPSSQQIYPTTQRSSTERGRPATTVRHVSSTSSESQRSRIENGGTSNNNPVVGGMSGGGFF